ncbi:PaaI family thioesterase [Chachezhania sediminis]|uniref:PaaI family thioesterase n=1 Tax=Chachezhania sediminis TaxID=2599291 RepID=UPI00131D111C|nr:PaaI family thioesterase [Chachezhania sediminis]
MAHDPDAIAKLFDASPFVAFLGLKVTEVEMDAGAVTMIMPMRPELARGGPIEGQFHGGAVASLIDTVGDFAVALTAGAPVPTMNFRVDYLRPSGGAYLTGRAVTRRLGKSMAVVDIDVTDSQGRLTAVGRGTYSPKVG